MATSLHFYVEGLGFDMTKKWLDEGVVRWCWLDLGGASLMLQQFWTAGRHRNVPDDKLGVGVSFNFICQDAVAVFREITSRGLQPSRPTVGNGMWVTQITDPDGYVLVFESPTDAPEETVRSEDH